MINGWEIGDGIRVHGGTYIRIYIGGNMFLNSGYDDTLQVGWGIRTHYFDLITSGAFIQLDF